MLLCATFFALTSAVLDLDTKQQVCKPGPGATCNRTIGALFLQQHHRAHRNSGSLRLDRSCSSLIEDCRDTGCCEDAGYSCYEKNQYWASCRESCEAGQVNPNDDPEYQTPWTCALIGGSSTSTTEPQVNPAPGQVFVANTAGSGKARLFEFIAALTDQPVANSEARAVHSSGGAAGGVVSESQGYGLLLTGALLAALPEDVDRQKIMDYTYEMFLGWRRMCELSKNSGSCQEDEGFQCGGGQYPCLPHWKFDDNLAYPIGSGAAPDGDADALAGMLLAVMSLERSTAQPSWLDEVGRWAYETCKQFYLSSTVSSSSGAHRIVKLGSCWGGWGNQGQNPSYHAPGVYRMCRNYMKSHDDKYGSAQEGDNFEADWNRLIATSYKMFDATQCEATGLIPNWAKVYEEGQSLRAETGFSGSGTPGAEYGAEASRAVWRVTLDYLLFPSEAGDAVAFLDPVAAHLETRESDGNWAESLRVEGNCLVESIHPGWSSNMFMAGPTFTSLVCPSNSVDSGRQQELINAAGQRVASKAIDDYYSGSWVAISTITLNGDLARAAQGAGLTSTGGSTTGGIPTTVTTTGASTTGATTTTTTSLGGSCAAAGQDCRTSACCQDVGFTCYEKNEYWASCRSSCEPGEISANDDPEFATPWTCTVLSGTGSTTVVGTTSTTTTTGTGTNPSSGHVFVTQSAGSGKARLFEFIAALTDQPVPGSQARAVHSSGGAAGGVVSESQGYGLLLSGALLAALPTDVDRQKIMDYTYETFLGWRRMCELSKDSGSCQEDEGFQCGGGQYPCLPHWKFDDNLAYPIGSGAAPDGDADALAGMMFAVLSLERSASSTPAWLDEVGQWTYDTCKQFYLSSTVSSSSGAHRIVKLGSCWGGWGNQGQNPSYHAPGVYRLCRNYMKSHDDKYGSNGEGDIFESDWNRLIATSYKMFDATQCDSTGLIPNWAKIYEEGPEQLRAETGFSGSGTPGAEYGSEASRTVWRVALDFLLFPGEAGDAAAFLDPVAAHLETRESAGNWAQTLRLDGDCLVESIHPSWSWNMFMAGPTFSSLVCPSNSVAADRQQELIDAAGVRIASKAIDDYYSGSWVAISTITLNGDLLRAAEGAGLLSTGTTSTTSTMVTTGTTSTSGTTSTAGTTSTTSTTSTTTVTTTTDGSTICSSASEDCRSTGCCKEEGYTCYEKDQYWAGCRAGCEAGAVNPKDPIEYRTPWSCTLIGGTTTTTSTTTTSTETTVTTTPMSFQMVFEAVDGGEDRACRGDSSNDNSDTYYRVVSAASLERCKAQCKATQDCQGLEFKGSRCELWTRKILASKSLSGYTCLRYVDPNALRVGTFEMMDGENHACRGASPVDNSNDYFHVTSGVSLEGCQRLCRGESSCVGVEHHQGGRCEIWTRPLGIQATSAKTGYSCWRFWPEGVEIPKPREGAWEAVDGAQGRVCRGASPSDNQQSYFTVMSGTSLDSCKDQCRMSKECQGVEFHSSGRCELWSHSIGTSKASDAGYSCWRFIETMVG